MVERVKLEPTMEEIVVALRETRRGASRTQPFAVVGMHAGGNRALGRTTHGDKAGDRGIEGDAHGGTLTDIADLRDGEIDRLLTDNTRLNERVVFLLKVIEREQASNAAFAAAHAAIETERSALGRDVRTALETELRPVLLVLLRMVEKQRTDPAEQDAGRAPARTARMPKPVEGSPGWIVDVARKPDGDGEAPMQKQAGAATCATVQQPKLRERMARVLDLPALLISFGQATHLRTSAACRRRPPGWSA